MPAPTLPITNVLTTDSLAAIQSKLNAVPAGGSLVFPAMTMPPGTLTGKSGIVVHAAAVVTTGGSFNFDNCDGWTVEGVSAGVGFIFSGSQRILAHNCTDITVGNCTFNDVTSNGFDGSCIAMNGTVAAKIINCDFNRCAGNNIGMYNISNMISEGNHFTDCEQPFSIQEPMTGDTTLGVDLIWHANVFLGTHRACIEVCPATLAPGQAGECTSGVVVENNFFDNFKPTHGASAMLPISLVAKLATNSRVALNYICKGNDPSSAGLISPAIEFAKDGQVAGNTVDGFGYTGIFYDAAGATNVHDNVAYNSGLGWLTYSGTTVVINPTNTVVTTPPTKPAWPARMAW